MNKANADVAEESPTPVPGLKATRESLAAIAPLWPIAVGLAVGRCSIIVPTYGSYVNSDEGVYTDGATMVFIALALVLVLVIAKADIHLEKKQVRRLMIGAVATQCVVMLCAGYASSFGVWPPSVRILVNGLNTLLGVIILGYWLRYVRGSLLSTVVVVLFSALAISEAELLVCAVLSNAGDLLPLPLSLSGMWDDMLSCALLVLEFPLMQQARRAPLACRVEVPGPSLMENASKDRGSVARLLIDNGVSIAVLALAIGLMRGFPAGLPIPFTFEARVICCLAIVAICLGEVIAQLAVPHRFPFSLRMWTLLLVLVAVVLILYAFLPDALYVGAVATTGLNALMVAFEWALIVAFMSFGWRDPYYYLFGGMIVFLFFRALARIGEFGLAMVGVAPSQMLVLIAVLAFASGILVASLYVRVLMDERDRVAARKSTALRAMMGVDADKKPASLEELRTEAMRENVRKLGESFLLSDREIEVLTLYALGHTQRKVAEELVISPDTVHAHIKRIYAKTGLHSRQDILDFVARYSE